MRPKGIMAQIDLHAKDKNNEKVQELLKQLVTNHKDSAEAMLTAGFIYQQKKDYANALIYFSQAVAANSSEAFNQLDKKQQKISVKAAQGAMYQIGRNAVLSEIEIAKGIEALETYLGYKISSGQPSHNWARTRLAALYLKQGDKIKAQQLATIAAKDESKGGPQKLAKKLLKSIKRG